MENSILNTISVLIVACPCALGLSVPAALVVGHWLQSKEGVLIKNPETAEILAKADRIFFDKTGTLTTGKLELQSEKIFADKSKIEQYRKIGISLEKYSTHPIARSFIKTLSDQKETAIAKEPSWSYIKEIPGQGIEGKNGTNTLYKIGNRNFALQLDSKNDGWIY